VTEKLNKRQQALFHRLSQPGTVLHCETDQTEEGLRNGGRRYFIEPGGAGVGPKTPQELIARGLLVGSHGLLPGDAQSYVVAQ
jgi:hypothetical protein